MQRHKIVARVILLILSIINLTLAAPVFLRGIHEVRIDVADYATTALRERWIPKEEWSTSAPNRENAPQNLESSDSENEDMPDLELELEQQVPDSPFSSVGSTSPHTPDPLRWAVGPPPPEHNNLGLDLGSNTFSGLNADPQPSLGLGPTDGTGFPSHLAGSSAPEHGDPYHVLSADPLRWAVGPPPPEHNNLRLNLGLNTFSDLYADSQPSLGLGPTDGTGFPSHLAGSSTPEHGDPYRLTGFDPSSDAMTYPWEWDDTWVTWKHPSPGANPPPQLGLGHGNLDEDSDHLLLSLEPPVLPSDPGPSTRPHSPSSVSYAEWAHPQDPGPSKWARPLHGEPQNLDPSRWVHPLFGEPLNADQSAWEDSSSSPPPDSNPPPQHGNLDEDFKFPLSRPRPGPGPIDDQPPVSPPLGAGPSTRPDPPSDAGPSTSTPHPPPNPGPQQHDLDFFSGDLFRGGRLKRHISDSHPSCE